MATNFLSATVAANDQATAAQYNNLRKDVVQNGGDAATSGGSANAYTLAIDAQIAAYAAFQVFKFNANFTNTGPATLNVNGIGAKTIKKNLSQDLVAGDIQSGQIILVSYDGTNLQLLSSCTTSANAKFGGTGADGALDTSGGTVNIDLGSAAYVEKNYTSINIVSNNLTFTNPHANGTQIVLKSQGNVVVSATIDASGLGAVGGATSGASGTDSGWKFDTASTVATGGSGTTAGAGGAIWAWTNQYTDAASKLHKRMIIVAPGSGGGAGQTGGAINGGVGGTLGAGGRGGAGLIIECAGGWDFTGTINVSGVDGSNGGNGTPNAGAATGGSGGGGGSGGQLLVLYNTLVANSGTATVSGGDGGNGGNGSGSSGDPGSGRAGGGGASRNTTAGGNGGSGIGSGGPGPGNSGSTPSGGGTGGTGGTSSGNGAGGSGGGGGAVGQSLITQNLWFA